MNMLRTKFIAKPVDVPITGPARVTLYPSVNQMMIVLRRSKLSTRRAVSREANRRGLLVGILSRATQPIGPTEARSAAFDSMHGGDPFGNISVPDRWHELFMRGFVKAAVHAAHTDRSITAR
jgi:hypothetical protein